MERRRNTGRRNMSGPYTYSRNHTAQNERFGIYRGSERKECDDNISKMEKYEVCVPKSRVLVQGLLCGSGKQTKWITLITYKIKAISLHVVSYVTS